MFEASAEPLSFRTLLHPLVSEAFLSVMHCSADLLLYTASSFLATVLKKQKLESCDSCAY